MTHLIPLRFHVNLIAGGLFLIVPLLAIAACPTPAAVVHVKVFPDHYAVNEQKFADVVALEASLALSDYRVVHLDNCGPASTRALLTVVERLHYAHTGVIELHKLPAGEEGCSLAKGVAIGAQGRVGSSEDSAYFATDSFGRSIMP